MSHLVINPGTEKEKAFLKELLQKLGYESVEIDLEEDEDISLLDMMVKEKKGDYVLKKELLKVLE
ncbi:hypothetical protein [Aquiflexum gelatinilyticum]|uniref:hypothetical protein n=1 Tax=Aquiflexum gelatinilyticum TaxID=2961943 RepID=UPI0021687F20|nr:hypothetical protein [Aquiflexum gelatinilyticum]MCS4434277.1 hypothetical protein [Aquiflexum gelatinilyticum]